MAEYRIDAYLPMDERRSKELEEAESSVFLVQYDGTLHAYLNRCPHLGIELNWMPDQFLESGGDLIICSTHGALFRIENGLCVAGPCQGKYLHKLDVIAREDGQYVHVPDALLLKDSLQDD